MITIFISGLPQSSTEESVTALFSRYGPVRAVKLVKDIFSGKCKGFATIEMEGHEGRAAITDLNGKEVNGSVLRVGLDRARKKKGGRQRH